MNPKIKNIASCIVLSFLLLISLHFLTSLMERKDSAIKYKSFLSQEEDFDVLFLGTSHVINGIYPMELWNEYGMISYNFGGYVNKIPTTYWLMKNALDYTKPKLIVIDCFQISDMEKADPNISCVHQSMDIFPLSSTKVSAVWDLLDDENVTVPEDVEARSHMGLLWDYAVYHARWNELSEEDFTAAASPEKGAETGIAISIAEKTEGESFGDLTDFETVGTGYLRKMISECQSAGIDVMLVYLPFPADRQAHREAAKAEEIAGEYQINCLNFLNMDVVDYNTDFYDNYSHLNFSGAQKVTEFLGQYIMENYNIPDQRSNESYSGWYNDYKAYMDFKCSNLRDQQTLDTYLMLLADKNYNITLEINDPAILKSNYYCHLFENLGISIRDAAETPVLFEIEESTKKTAVSPASHSITDQNHACAVHLITTNRHTDGIVDDVCFSYQGNEITDVIRE